MTTGRDGEVVGAEPGQVVYLYGIVPADVRAEPHARGVGDPPSPVTTVVFGQIAALIGVLPADKPLGTPQDLLAHAELLDGTVTVAPVLPLRFGVVLADADAVTEELLAAHHDELAAALDELDGRAQFVVRGRYVEATVLGEILAAAPDAARLRERIRGRPEVVTRDERMALGQLVTDALDATRHTDTAAVVEALAPLTVAVSPRPPTDDLDATHLAVLIDLAEQQELEDLVAALADRWHGRVELSLLGPMAAYDFVVKPDPQD